MTPEVLSGIYRKLLQDYYGDAVTVGKPLVAVAIVLLLVTLGAVSTDLIAEIAKGKVPAGLLLSQLGLRSIRFLTLVLPLGGVSMIAQAPALKGTSAPVTRPIGLWRWKKSTRSNPRRPRLARS